ncbi:MAG: hypothetical protein E6575_04755 [Bradyrhizobium sp.]|nr:hypothetical protein [Bradyrhizobium sp.]
MTMINADLKIEQSRSDATVENGDRRRVSRHTSSGSTQRSKHFYAGRDLMMRRASSANYQDAGRRTHLQHGLLYCLQLQFALSFCDMLG